MYSYYWDSSTGGFILTTEPLKFSKEPRPVYYQELDILGFDKHWNYEKDDSYPYMWAEANNYWYRGRKVAKIVGGSLYNAPKIELFEDPEPSNGLLVPVDIKSMVYKNKEIMDMIVQKSIQNVYNTYINYKSKVDIFYVAFSGGKDSVVALDIVQRALSHSEFKVLFGNTGMEFPDTYTVVEKIKKYCVNNNIDFLEAKSKIDNDISWKCFGPPSVTNRWCCSVHKTSPQINILKKTINLSDFTGMAFTGVRGDESAKRSNYEDLSFGQKHSGQYSYHTILDWNSAELFNYIYERKLVLNDAYKKGNTRAGCLVCPNSTGKHEYIKRQCYKENIDKYISFIASTSGKSYEEKELKNFIDNGFWRTRKSGRELNFGYDKHLIENINNTIEITVFTMNSRWKKWATTIGEFIENDRLNYSIEYDGKVYNIVLKELDDGTKFIFPNCNNSKKDIQFIKLFRSCIIKSLYCVNCGVCEAECRYGYISMQNGLDISKKCKHCYACHNVHEHCLRYNSIRNKIGAEKNMKGLGRYFTFGVKEEWMDTFFDYKGGSDFWDSDGNSKVANKKKDAFLKFVVDAEMVVNDRKSGHDKYTRYIPSDFCRSLLNIRESYSSDIVWALILCNLVYTSDFNWFVKNIPFDLTITQDYMKMLLESVMENDKKGLGKRNVVDAFKTMLIKTPLGDDLGLGICDYDEKVSSNGRETIKLNSFYRTFWKFPEPLVILYSLYKFAEACDGYYEFTLTRLLNHEIESNGVSPTQIFGLDREKMETLLTGLSMNYPDFINATFTIDLDNITLRKDKKSFDVLALFEEV